MTWAFSPKMDAASNPNLVICMRSGDRGLTVNQAKTKAVAFNQRTHKTNSVFAGQAVEQADRYKHLGVVMHQIGSVMCAVESPQIAA